MSTETIELLMNGQWLSCAASTTLADWLMEQGYLSGRWQHSPQATDISFVVALNQHVVRWQDWPETVLASGDSVDVLGAITGG